MIIFHHAPPAPTPTRQETKKPGVKSNQKPLGQQFVVFGGQQCPYTDGMPPFPPTWEESVALLVQQYIPKDEIPLLGNLDGPSSRICGGWVQALFHVDQSNANFESMLLPAARALTLSMLVADNNSQQQYLNTYVDALQGIRCRLAAQKEVTDNVAALAGMCLAVSEALMPTSEDGWTSHLRGVAAMMYAQGPETFIDGISHLLFVGFRPLIVLDSIVHRTGTFLEEESWRTIPFTKQRCSTMQDLLGYGTSIASLLEKVDRVTYEVPEALWSLSVLDQTLQDWETSHLQQGDVGYWPVTPNQLNLNASLQGLPDTCFAFPNVASGNALTHCWAFRVVCLLEVMGPERSITDEASSNNATLNEGSWRSRILDLTMMICQGLPYLVQQNMGLYGPLSAAFPLGMVNKTIHRLGLQDHRIAAWHSLIQAQIVPRHGPSVNSSNR